VSMSKRVKRRNKKQQRRDWFFQTADGQRQQVRPPIRVGRVLCNPWKARLDTSCSWMQLRSVLDLIRIPLVS